jgi:hypothetical protein
VHCPSGFRRLLRLTGSRRRSGPPLLRFFVPTTLCLRVPRSATTGPGRSQETRGSTPSPGSALGFSQPLGGFSRSTATIPGCPEPAVPAPLRPEASRPCFMPLASLGFTLQSFPLPRSRAASRRPLLPCGFDVDRTSGAKVPRLSDRFPPPSAPLRRPEPPVRRTSRIGHGRGSVASPRSSRPPVHPTSCPVKRPRRPTGDLRARRHTAVSPASKLCSPRESVLATDRALPPDSRPKVLSRPTGPVLSWVSAPSELSPPRPRVRQTATSARHAEHSRKSKPRSGRQSSRASILRPRPSGTSGGSWVAAHSPRRRTLRASAPPYGGAPSSLALHRPAQPWLPVAAGLQRTQGRGSRSISSSSRPSETGQLSWGSLPPDASSSFKARATPGL